jgi:flagellin
MLSLHTNAASLSTQNALGNTQKALTTSMSRLGTGFRVNSAMDDAAGLQIATRLNAQTRGMGVAQRNTQNAISMLQTAEGALAEVSNIVTRMKDLATEARNGAANANDKAAMNAEYQALGAEITNILTNTRFGGQALLNGAGSFQAGAIRFQIGASAAESYDVDVSTNLAALVTALGTPGAVDTEAAAATAITNTETWINNVGTIRAQMGAAGNRLESVHNNLGNMIQNTAAAKGRIVDVDYARETANMTSKQMLMQASSAMLKQSSSMSQMVASLLQ